MSENDILEDVLQLSWVQFKLDEVREATRQLLPFEQFERINIETRRIERQLEDIAQGLHLSDGRRDIAYDLVNIEKEVDEMHIALCQPNGAKRRRYDQDAFSSSQ